MIKIDDIDRRILFELDNNCRISDNKISKIVRRTRESVGYRIRRLQERGILRGFITSINPSKCGFMFFKLYFQLANIPKERERFFMYMKQLPGLYWLGVNDGAWDTHATIYAKDIKEFYSMKNQIYSEFKELIIKRDTGVLVNVHQYRKKFLIAENSTQDYDSYSVFADEVVPFSLDDLEQKIIKTLSHDARISIVDLARKTNSTIEVVRNRMNRLEEKGIILQYRIAIDHAKLGYEFFKAFLYFNNLTSQDEKRLFEYCKIHPNIIYLIRQISGWDAEIEIVCKNYDEFTTIMNDIRQKFSSSMRNYESVLMKEDIWVFGDT